MKKLIVPTILVLLFCAFGACNSDDDQTAPPQTVEDPMEENPIEEDPVDEVVERTDRYLDYVWNLTYGSVMSLEYENNVLNRVATGGRSVKIEALDGDKISSARIRYNSQGGSLIVIASITYNEEWIQGIHLQYSDDDGEAWEENFEFDQSGYDTIITMDESWDEWTITFTEGKRWLQVSHNDEGGLYANYSYQDGNLIEASYQNGTIQSYQYDIRHNPYYLESNTNFTYVEPILRLLIENIFGYSPYTGVYQNVNNVTTHRTFSPIYDQDYEYEYDEFDFPTKRIDLNSGQPNLDINFTYLK